jgi:hypothetical protein
MTLQRYKVNTENKNKYQENIRHAVDSMISKQSNETNEDDNDKSEDDLNEKFYKRI